ncbi:hypothetical protein WBJ53_08685 [Spirosoma sp. SC4-14]|uniref:hypothetical protein n=1 Tax=Spirosoma sp. SC4-14 TaxID=3128900 RepID=UPI0030CF173A
MYRFYLSSALQNAGWNPRIHRNRKMASFSTSTSPFVSNSARRLETIRADFARQQERGIKSAVIIAELAERYFLTEQTVEAMVWKRGRYAVSVSTSNPKTA